MVLISTTSVSDPTMPFPSQPRQEAMKRYEPSCRLPAFLRPDLMLCWLCITPPVRLRPNPPPHSRILSESVQVIATHTIQMAVGPGPDAVFYPLLPYPPIPLMVTRTIAVKTNRISVDALPGRLFVFNEVSDRHKNNRQFSLSEFR